MKTYFKTTDKATIPNYPYGYRQRTTAYYSLEHKAGHGFRTVFQTINPKTGALNKPKFSTYSDVIVMFDDNGKIDFDHLSFYGDDGFKKDIAYMAEHFDLFTTDQIKSIALNCIAITRADIIAKTTYCGSDTAKLLPLYDVAIRKLVDIAKTGENLFNQVIVDFDAVKSLEVKGFNPFKTTIYNLN